MMPWASISYSWAVWIDRLVIYILARPRPSAKFISRIDRVRAAKMSRLADVDDPVIQQIAIKRVCLDTLSISMTHMSLYMSAIAQCLNFSDIELIRVMARSTPIRYHIYNLPHLHTAWIGVMQTPISWILSPAIMTPI